jgi:hypothetical protein
MQRPLKACVQLPADPRTGLPQLIVNKFKLGCHAIPLRSLGMCPKLRGHINANVDKTRRVFKVLRGVLRSIVQAASCFTVVHLNCHAHAKERSSATPASI